MNGGCTKFAYCNGKLLNIAEVRRKTAYQPEQWKHTIYCMGTCVFVGYGAPYDKTVERYLQKRMHGDGEYLVENVSQFYNGRYQDIFYNLNALPVKEGDIIFICINDRALRGIPHFNMWNLFARPHNYGEVFIDKYHVNEKGNEIIADKFYQWL